MKWQWLERRWQDHDDWLIKAKSRFTAFTLRYQYKAVTQKEGLPVVITTPPLKRKRKSLAAQWFDDDDDDDFDQPLKASIEQQIAKYNAKLRSQILKIKVLLITY